jgi:hypothetical protein
VDIGLSHLISQERLSVSKRVQQSRSVVSEYLDKLRVCGSKRSAKGAYWVLLVEKRSNLVSGDIDGLGHCPLR